MLSAAKHRLSTDHLRWLAVNGYGEEGVTIQDLNALPGDVRRPLWRRCWIAWYGVPLAEVSVAKRLADAPRPGVQPRLSPEQVCQILALAHEQPSGSGRSISQWSHRELADEIVRRGFHV